MKRWDAASQLAIEVCTASKEIMGRLLELPEEDLRCCLKVFYVGFPKGDDQVATLARSEEFIDFAQTMFEQTYYCGWASPFNRGISVIACTSFGNASLYKSTGFRINTAPSVSNLS